MKRLAMPILVTSLLTSAAAQAATSPRYALTLLPPPGDTSSASTFAEANAINNVGQIVGRHVSTTAPSPQPGLWSTQATLWEAGEAKDLGTVAGRHPYTLTTAMKINDTGQAVGLVSRSTDPLAISTRAAKWQSGQIQELESTLPSMAFDINGRGHAVGYHTADGRDRASVWTDAGRKDLGPADGNSRAQAINKAGQIAGHVDQHAVLWDGNKTVNLEDRGLLSLANDINDSGWAVGFIGGIGAQKAAMWREGLLTELTTGAADTSEASAINNKGQVVGNFGSIGPRHAALWNEGTLVDLNALVAPQLSGWTLIQANDINDAGQIVGWAVKLGGASEGARMGFLLTPVPEPATVTMVLAGLAWLRLRRTGS